MGEKGRKVILMRRQLSRRPWRRRRVLLTTEREARLRKQLWREREIREALEQTIADLRLALQCAVLRGVAAATCDPNM